MIFGLEIALVIWGLMALFSGKITLSKQRVVEGPAARIAGVVFMLPWPVSYVLGYGLRVSQLSQGRPLVLKEWMPTLIVMELIVIAVCVGLGFLIAQTGVAPTSAQPKFPPDEDDSPARKPAPRLSEPAPYSEPIPEAPPRSIQPNEHREPRPPDPTATPLPHQEPIRLRSRTIEDDSGSQLPVMVKSEHERYPSGRWKGRLSPKGLWLRQANGNPPAELWLQPGIPASYIEGNRLRVTVDGRNLALTILKVGVDQHRLAEDIADFLSGKRRAVQPSEFAGSRKLLLAPALLSIGVPAFAIWMQLIVGGALGGVMWVTLGLLMAGLCVFIARKESWPSSLRFFAGSMLIACCYLGVGLLYLASVDPGQELQAGLGPNGNALAPGAQPEEPPGAPAVIPAGAWKEFSPPRGGLLLMPGIPVVQEQPVLMAGHTFTLHSVELAQQEQAFFFGKAELHPAEFDQGGVARLQGSLDSLLALHPGSEAVQQEQRPFGDGQFAEQVYVQLADGKTRLVARFFSVGRRAYYLAVRGPALTPRDADVIKFLDSFELPSRLPGGEKLPSPAAMPGVVAYWPFDEGSGDATADATGRTRPASITGGAWKPGVKGTGLELSGKVELPHNDSLNFNGKTAFTIAGWVRTDQHQGGIVSFAHEKGQARLDIFVREGQLRVDIREANVQQAHWTVLHGGQIDDGLWHHFVLTRQGDGTLELFLDGDGYGRAKNGGPLWFTRRYFGFKQDAECAEGRLFDQQLRGSIDEFCVFNRALSEKEIRSLAGEGIRPLPGIDPDTYLKVADPQGEPVLMPLLGRWTFDDKTSLRGTAYGARLVPGIKGQALEFNGKGNYFDYGTSPKYNFGRWFAIAGWVKTNRKQGTILSQRSSDDPHAMLNVLVEDGQLAVRWQANNQVQGHVLAGGTIADGQWHHFAVVREMKLPEWSWEIYVDGVSQGRKLAGQDLIKTDIRSFGAEPKWIKDGGVPLEKCYLEGALDEVHFFEYPLPPWAVKQVMSLTGGNAVGQQVVNIKPEPPVVKPPEPVVKPQNNAELKAPREKTYVAIERATAFALSADGKQLATAKKNELKLWDTASGKELASLTAKEQADRLLFSPDGRFLAAAGADPTKRVYIYQLPDFTETSSVMPLWPKVPPGSASWRFGMAFSPDNKALAVAAGPNVTLVETTSRKQMIFVTEAKSQFRSVAFAPDNRSLYTAASPQEGPDQLRLVVQRWAPGGKELSRSAATFAVSDARNSQLTTDGKYLGTSFAGSASIWDLDANVEIKLPLNTDEQRAYCLQITPNGKQALTGSHDGTLRLWDIAANRVLVGIQAHGKTEPVYAIEVAASGKLIATKMNEGIKLFDPVAALGRTLDPAPVVVRVDPPMPPATDPPKPPATDPPMPPRPAEVKLTTRRASPLTQLEVKGLSLSADGKVLALSTKDGVVLFDTTNEKEIGRFDDKRPFQRPMMFSPDGKWLFHLTRDMRSGVRIREGASGKEQASFEHGAMLGSNPLAVSPDSKTLATICSTSILLWEVPGGERRELVSKSRVIFSSGGFTADGKKLRTAGTRSNGMGGLELVTQLWEVETGKELDLRVILSARTVPNLAISPGCRFLAHAPSLGQAVTMIDMESPDRSPTLSGKPMNVDKFAFAPDGRALATLGRDGKVVVWDIVKGDALGECQFRTTPSQGTFVGFSADGKSLAVSTAEGVMLVDLSKLAR
jgi:WD40 repeat protein